MWNIIFYMLPEMLIISFIMFNEIMLHLNGIYEVTENQFETIQDSVDRWKARGDMELYKQN